MTTRPRVAVVLGVAGLVVAVAQVLLVSTPPTWFQIAVVAFWGVVGGAYLLSGLVQQRRDPARSGRPDRHRVPDGELSTGGPGEDAEVGRRGDMTPRGHTPGRGAAFAGDDDRTAVVPRIPPVPVRAARPRPAMPAPAMSAPLVPAPTVPAPAMSAPAMSAPAMAAGRPAAPALTPAGTGDTPRPAGYPTLLPGRPAPVATGPAAGTVPPPSAVETTAARLSPWPHAAVAAPSVAVPAPVAPIAPATVAAPSVAVPAPVAPAASTPVPAAPVAAVPVAPAEVTDVHPRVAVVPSSPPAPPVPPLPSAPRAPIRAADASAPEAPASPAPTVRPVTSPSFAIRFAEPAEEPEQVEPVDDARQTRRERAGGRHAVPEATVADEMAPRRHRHRRPADTGEQPVVTAGAHTPARRHRASGHRRAG